MQVDRKQAKRIAAYLLIQMPEADKQAVSAELREARLEPKFYVLPDYIAENDHAAKDYGDTKDKLVELAAV